MKAYTRLDIHEEVKAGALTRNIEIFVRFMDVLALSNAKEISYQDLASDAGVLAWLSSYDGSDMSSDIETCIVSSREVVLDGAPDLRDNLLPCHVRRRSGNLTPCSFGWLIRCFGAFFAEIDRDLIPPIATPHPSRISVRVGKQLAPSSVMVEEHAMTTIQPVVAHDPIEFHRPGHPRFEFTWLSSVRTARNFDSMRFFTIAICPDIA